MCIFYVFLFDCGGSVTEIVQCPEWNYGANRPCHDPILYFVQGPWRHCRSNHNNKRCGLNLEVFAGRNLGVPIIGNISPEQVDMLILDNDMTDEEAWDFINTNRNYHNAGNHPGNARENYPTYPTNTTGHYSPQTRGDYPSSSTSYNTTGASAEELRVINQPGANSHFHSIQRFDDGSAWVRWERDEGEEED